MRISKVNTNILIAIGCSLMLQNAFAATSNEEEINYCNQQLIRASASCSDTKILESCISEQLKSSGCESEITTEDDINVCSDSCTPIVDMSLLDEDSKNNKKKNILPLTEGE